MSTLVDRADLVDLMDNLISDGDAKGYLLMYAFQGFNPIDFLQVLNERAKKLDHIKTKADMMKDMAAIILWVVKRGIRFTDTARNTKSANDAMKILIKNWEINFSVGAPEKPNIITIGRIAATFPHLVSIYILKYANTSPSIGACPALLPRCLAHPGGITLIPKTWVNLRTYWFEWSLNFDATINSGVKTAGSKRTPTYPDPQKVLQFFHSLSDSPLFGDVETTGQKSERKILMKKLEIPNDVNQAHPKSISDLVKEQAELNVALGRVQIAKKK